MYIFGFFLLNVSKRVCGNELLVNENKWNLTLTNKIKMFAIKKNAIKIEHNLKNMIMESKRDFQLYHELFVERHVSG